MGNEIIIPDEYSEGIFAKVVPFLDDYQICKLKLQQLKMRGNYDPSVECRIKEQLAKAKNKIEQIIYVQ
jgi:hypothetical protein